LWNWECSWKFRVPLNNTMETTKLYLTIYFPLRLEVFLHWHHCVGAKSFFAISKVFPIFDSPAFVQKCWYTPSLSEYCTICTNLLNKEYNNYYSMTQLTILLSKIWDLQSQNWDLSLNSTHKNQESCYQNQDLRLSLAHNIDSSLSCSASHMTVA